MNKPTYEELEARIVYLEKVVQRLLAKIAELEAKIGKNSKNSSAPPSKDRKVNLPLSPKQRTEAKHPGVQRQLLPESMVTSKETRVLDNCPRCNAVMRPTGTVVKWQQIELPPIQPLVHQWDLCECACPRCGVVKTPVLKPEESLALGPRLEAFVGLLLARFRHSHLLVREFITVLLPAVRLSQGLISKIKKRASVALEAPYLELWTGITNSPEPKHIEATGWWHKGVNEHAIVVRAGHCVAFSLKRHQNTEVIGSPLGKDCAIVTDRGLPTNAVQAKTHQYCLAHLLRNIQGIAEHPQTSLEETEYLGKLYDNLQALFHEKKSAEP